MTLAITSIQCWSLQDRFTLGVPRLRTGTSAIPGGFPVPPSAAQPLHCTWQPWVQLIIVSAFIKSQECGTTIDLFTLPRSSIKKISKSYTTVKVHCQGNKLYSLFFCKRLQYLSLWVIDTPVFLCTHYTPLVLTGMPLLSLLFSWHSAWG